MNRGTDATSATPATAGGGGSTFLVEIPATVADSAPARPATQEAQSPAHPTTREGKGAAAAASAPARPATQEEQS
eukprot:CAMPEP_0194308966 /NCGR_PEP_ID=MMETSP0171-20130528/5926_1 /TAXON_ID=218684 /ORGANISM="Corethron pennatum, Strain L29A3" /LENGTH=74 /DNA_ID=CAMNT_0039061875 /DNA_START=253 /DNA_END=474 /DNA_ORIENTATION=-